MPDLRLYTFLGYGFINFNISSKSFLPLLGAFVEMAIGVVVSLVLVIIFFLIAILVGLAVVVATCRSCLVKLADVAFGLLS